jgi:hypothetical protein
MLRVQVLAVTVAAAIALASFGGTAFAANPQKQAVRQCVRDIVQDARDAGFKPKQAARQAGFDTKREWKQFLREGECADAWVEPPPF